MLKILFLKSNEIEEIIEKDLKIYQVCEINFNEADDKEEILIKEDNKVKDVLSIESIFPILEKAYNVSIFNYDVYEVSSLGDGFAFTIT